MERWSKAIAVVTGATGGIGSAVTVGLANAGMTVIAIDVHLDRIHVSWIISHNSVRSVSTYVSLRKRNT